MHINHWFHCTAWFHKRVEAGSLKFSVWGGRAVIVFRLLENIDPGLRFFQTLGLTLSKIKYEYPQENPHVNRPVLHVREVSISSQTDARKKWIIGCKFGN